MLNANWCGSWSAYWPMFSNHSRLACAARWVEAPTGRPVAAQHHVLMPPRLAPHGAEAHPPGVVGEQLVSAQHVRAQAADHLDRGLVALPGHETGRGHVAETGPPPHIVVHLQDEGAGPLAVRVAVHLHDPGRGVQDVELERVEHQVRAEPDVLAPALPQVG